MGATEAAGKASRPWGAPTMGLHDDLFLRQELPVPARAGPQQRARVVPDAPGRLRNARARPRPGAAGRPAAGPAFRERALQFRTANRQIGRASDGERGCQYVFISVVDVSFT